MIKKRLTLIEDLPQGFDTLSTHRVPPLYYFGTILRYPFLVTGPKMFLIHIFFIMQNRKSRRNNEFDDRLISRARNALIKNCKIHAMRIYLSKIIQFAFFQSPTTVHETLHKFT